MIDIVAEIGINANGSVEIAKKLIDISVNNGIKYVKFQKRDIPSCYSEGVLNTERESPWGTTTREQKYGLEFTEDEYNEIDCYCKINDIRWFASAWDEISVDFLCQYDIPYIKVPSALITDLQLLDHIKSKSIPVIISTGMSTEKEIHIALKVLGDSCTTILHTTSIYPASVAELNLQKIITLQETFGYRYKVGYSNHSPSVMAVIFAAVLGAEMIEFHITLDRSMYGTDQSAAIERRGVETITDWITDLPYALGDGKWKIFDKEIAVMEKLRKRTDLLLK
jgi:N-acetylneuraminate synthase